MTCAYCSTPIRWQATTRTWVTADQRENIRCDLAPDERHHDRRIR
jgi:hypothetical protein